MGGAALTAMAVLAGAFILDLLIGDPRWIPHPVIQMGKAIKGMENWIRRQFQPEQFKMAGLLLPLVVAGGSLIITWVLLKVLNGIHPWLGWAAEVALIATTIAVKGLKDAGKEVYRHLAIGDLPAARRSLSMIVGRETSHLDGPEIVRGTVETVAENIVDAVISPLFCALIGGAPLAMAYRAVNTLDSMVGYKNEKYLHLGWASARLDDIANWIPARLTALLLTVSAFLLRMNWRRAWRTMRQDARKHPSPNSGFPESTVAGALGIRLGGVNVYHGVESFRAYMGEAFRPMKSRDILLANRLLLTVSVLFVLMALLVIWAAGGTLWT
ncbi:adenosylcobinamide-phosphate synthase CbiB [Paenibacillus sp. VCA1]|nr:adenosylcobinamide-phosphate synthase CbiB [Paenibacillus sp. VCA1]MDR9856164.1 adenosylcobinamide-phosphate synthase CbiB [Paenibacillus sp. VCA1]